MSNAAAAKAAAAAIAANANAINVVTTATPNTFTHIKVGATQIKPIINTSNASAPSPIIVSSNTTNLPSASVISTPSPLAMVTSITTATVSSTTTTTPGSKASAKSQAASQSAASKASAAAKEKERKASASFYQQSSMASSVYGDDDINDVAAMGGVNLVEESQRILGSTEMIGRQIRSCKDEVFLHLPSLQAKIRGIIAKHGMEEPTTEVAVLVSHACQERLKNIVEKLAVIAEHRIDIIKVRFFLS